MKPSEILLDNGNGMKRRIPVGIADMKVSNSLEEVLITYSLGSCVGVTIYDPIKKIGGMVHCKIPQFQNVPVNRLQKSECFVDLGIPMLINMILNAGGKKERLQIKIAGCGDMYKDHGMFKIGQKNLEMTQKIFAKHGLKIHAEDVGGSTPRTMQLHINTGKTMIYNGTSNFEL